MHLSLSNPAGSDTREVSEDADRLVPIHSSWGWAVNLLCYHLQLEGLNERCYVLQLFHIL